jgi:hypothetical protein
MRHPNMRPKMWFEPGEADMNSSEAQGSEGCLKKVSTLHACNSTKRMTLTVYHCAF